MLKICSLLGVGISPDSAQGSLVLRRPHVELRIQPNHLLILWLKVLAPTPLILHSGESPHAFSYPSPGKSQQDQQMSIRTQLWVSLGGQGASGRQMGALCWPAVPHPWGHLTLFSTRTIVLLGMGGLRSPPVPVNFCGGRSALLRSCLCPPQGSITLISCQGVGEAISLGHFSSSVAYSQWSRFLDLKQIWWCGSFIRLGHGTGPFLFWRNGGGTGLL